MVAVFHNMGRCFLRGALVLFLGLSVVTGASAQTNEQETVLLKPIITSDLYTTLTNVVGNQGYDFAFSVGEELYYKIYWGWIPVGKSRIITRWVEKDGKRYLAVRYRTRGNSVIRKIYNVDDTIESIIDPDTFLPVIFTKNLKEGRHRYHEQTTFDFEKKEANWKSFIRQKEKTYDIKEDTRDLLCFLYYMRKLSFEEGDVQNVEVMADEKLYEMELNAHDLDKVRTKGFGKIRAMKLEFKAKFQGLFVRKGKMMTWLSRDERKVVVRVEVKVPLARVKVLIHEVRGPGDDVWIKKTKEKQKKGDKDKADEAEVDAALEELDAQ